LNILLLVVVAAEVIVLAVEVAAVELLLESVLR
jgi:hypothetical protein